MIKFEINSQRENEIKEWDQCVTNDVSGGRFSYTFTPTGIGTAIEVTCDICKRKLLFNDF